MANQFDSQLLKRLSGNGGVGAPSVHQGPDLLAVDHNDDHHGACVDGGDLVDLLKEVTDFAEFTAERVPFFHCR